MSPVFPEVESVRGTIIGGDWMYWQLCYDGKPIMSQEAADTEEEIMQKARDMKHRLQSEWKSVGLYQEDKFDVRIWDNK